MNFLTQGIGNFSEQIIFPGINKVSSFEFLFTFNNNSACCPGVIKSTLFVEIIPDSNLPYKFNPCKPLTAFLVTSLTINLTGPSIDLIGAGKLSIKSSKTGPLYHCAFFDWIGFFKLSPV